MNQFAESLMSLAWAMEAQALQRFLSHVAGVTEAQIEHTMRAITEKPELLDRLHARSGNVSANTLRRGSDVTEADLDIRNGVAHIPIAGPMMKQVPSMLNFLGIRATSTEATREMLGAALDSDRVESIVLDIDSPGGTVDGTSALAGDVFAMRGLKPIVARVDDLMASAALWVGAQADRIEIGHSAKIGSIGTVAVVDDSSRQFEKKGIKVHVISSGEMKGAGAEGAPITDAQIADIQRNIDSMTSLFVKAVARGRGMSVDAVDKIATGQVWIGAEAVDLGLADSVDAGDGSNAVAAGIGVAAPTVRQSYAAGLVVPREVINPPAGDDDSLAGALASMRPGEVLDHLNTDTNSDHAASAAQQEQETMNEQEQKELAQLRADNAALKLKDEQQEAAAEKIRLETEATDNAKRTALLTEYADRFHSPEVRATVTTLIGSMAPDAAESYLKDLPKITRDERISTAEIVEGAYEIAKHGAAETVGERSLGKAFGQSVDRVRDMCAIGEAVSHVEYESERVDGQIQMTPYAVMTDGRRLKRSELRSTLGLKGAMVGIALMIGLLFSGTARAGALTDARATQCRLTGITKAYLMTASNTIYAGSLVMVDSAGTVVSAAAVASNKNVAGVAQETKTSASSGATWIRVSDNVICKFAGSTLEQEDVGSLVYAEDDQTVDESVGSNEPVAGVLIQYVSASSGWVYVSSKFSFGRVATITSPTTLAGDLTLGGGVNALSFSIASTINLLDNDAASLGIGLNQAGGSFLVLDMTDSNEELNVVGTTATSAFRVDTGFATFDEQSVHSAGMDVNGDILAGGGVGALTFDAGSSSILTTDNAASGLDIGAPGDTDIISIGTLDAGPIVEINAGFIVLPDSGGAAIGWLVADGANTACSTTCAGTGGCVMGIDSATHVFVLCGSALADSCLCSGPTS